MEAVPSDPPFDSVLHELEVEDGFTGFRVLEEVWRAALRTGARSGTLDCRAGRQDLGGSRISPDFVGPPFVGLHIDPLSLVVPVSRVVYDIQFREGERILFETIRVFPLQVCRVNDVTGRGRPQSERKLDTWQSSAL